MFNISTFKSQLSTLGYLTPSRFQVIVTPPPMMSGQTLKTTQADSSVNNLMQNLTFRTDDVMLPGLNLVVTEVNRWGVGPSQRQPINTEFDTFNFSVILDKNSVIAQFWYQWLKNITNFSGSNNGQNGTTNVLPTYAVRYKIDYSSIVTINLFDMEGNLATSYYFNQAYPVLLNDTHLNWGENDQLIRLSIEMTYTDFIINGSDISKITISGN